MRAQIVRLGCRQVTHDCSSRACVGGGLLPAPLQRKCNRGLSQAVCEHKTRVRRETNAIAKRQTYGHFIAPDALLIRQICELLVFRQPIDRTTFERLSPKPTIEFTVSKYRMSFRDPRRELEQSSNYAAW